MEIVKGVFFTYRTIVMCLIGNYSFCGSQVFRLHVCPTPRVHFTFVKKVVFGVSGAIALILCYMFLVFFRRGNMHMQNFDFAQDIFQKLEHQSISYQELHIVTSIFIKPKLLRMGSFGSLYKGILSDGTIVIVKVI
jgi:LRR receptor-like serine/threonine-protein kinase FLS2